MNVRFYLRIHVFQMKNAFKMKSEKKNFLGLHLGKSIFTLLICPRFHFCLICKRSFIRKLDAFIDQKLYFVGKIEIASFAKSLFLRFFAQNKIAYRKNCMPILYCYKLKRVFFVMSTRMVFSSRCCWMKLPAIIP